MLQDPALCFAANCTSRQVQGGDVPTAVMPGGGTSPLSPPPLPHAPHTHPSLSRLVSKRSSFCRIVSNVSDAGEGSEALLQWGQILPCPRSVSSFVMLSQPSQPSQVISPLLPGFALAPALSTSHTALCLCWAEITEGRDLSNLQHRTRHVAGSKHQMNSFARWREFEYD